MKKLLILLLSLCFLLPACADEGEKYLLYRPVTQLETVSGEGAIETVPFSLDGAQEMETQSICEALVRALLQEKIAPGVQLLNVKVEGRRVDVDFSREYAALSGIDLTLADYCVTLTLTQLDGVNAVSITSGGKPLAQRKSKILTAADPLLGITEDTLRPVTVQLYFWDNESESLVPETRTLELHEGQSRVDALLEALTAGPIQTGGMAHSVPETLEVISARVLEGVCYLHLAGVESLSASAVEAIELSVLSLPNLDKVILLLDGAESEIR